MDEEEYYSHPKQETDVDLLNIEEEKQLTQSSRLLRVKLLQFDHEWETVKCPEFNDKVSYASCVVIDDVVYAAEDAYCFQLDLQNNKWEMLEPPGGNLTRKYFSLGQLGKELVMIGGHMVKQKVTTNEIMKFRRQQFEPNDDYQAVSWETWPYSMEIPLCCPIIACNDRYIIVIGGKKTFQCQAIVNDDIQYVDVRLGQWSVVKPKIPSSLLCSHMSAIIVGNKYLFISSLAETVAEDHADQISCGYMSLDDLKGIKTSEEEFAPEWKYTKNAPPRSLLVYSGGKTIFAFSGEDVYLFNSFMTNEWIRLSCFPRPIDVGSAVAVTNGGDTFIFIGGKNESGEPQSDVQAFKLKD